MMIRTSVAAFAAGLANCAASPVDDLCRYTGNCDHEIREKPSACRYGISNGRARNGPPVG